MAVLLLDTNCLIDLDKGREPRATALRVIVDAASNGEHEVVAAAISASENAPQGSEKGWGFFTDRLERIGLEDIRLVHPMGYYGVTFWGHALWVDDEMKKLEANIHTILVPHLPIVGNSEERKWLNAKCDVQKVWCHIWHGTDALITSDGGILRKAEALAEVRATVKSPAAAAAEL